MGTFGISTGTKNLGTVIRFTRLLTVVAILAPPGWKTPAARCFDGPRMDLDRPSHRNANMGLARRPRL